MMVVCVVLPLVMAFGIASGVKPEQGLITAIIGGALVSLLGGSKVQMIEIGRASCRERV